MLPIIWAIYLLIGCGQSTQQTPATSSPLARVHRAHLYQLEVANLIPSGISEQDSLALLNRYVNDWVLTHLIAQKAEKTLPKELLSNTIEKKVADFRSALLMHYYLEAAVDNQADTVVSQQEITQYYHEYRNNFILNRNIVKGKFIILPKRVHPPIPIKNWMESVKASDQAELAVYCKKFATDYLLDNNDWVDWDRMVTTTALVNIPDKARLLKANSFITVQDAAYKYYLKIEDHRGVNDVAPISFVAKEIEKLIMHKRKVKRIEQFKEDILKQASINHDYTIYIPN
jgi:hypothetical protein